MNVEVTINALQNSKNLIIPVFSNNLDSLDKIVAKLTPALRQQHFTGEQGSAISFNCFEGYDKVIVIGLGKSEEADLKSYKYMKCGGKAASFLTKYDEEVTVVLSHIANEQVVKCLALNITSGIKLRTHRFTKYFNSRKTKLHEPEKLNLIKVDTSVNVQAELEHGEALVEGMILTRNISIAAPNELNSTGFVKEIEHLRNLGVEIEVLQEEQLKEMGMDLLLSVNKGSANEALVAIMKWNGAGNNEQPVAFVGKGVTFDTGGYSLKGPSFMIGMKGDLGGAATVAGLIKSLAMRKAKVNAVGVVGLVENMVSGEATRPGDVVKSYSGKTVEILNTDAEGRLVLADILYYTQQRFKPKFMINLATLTGAIIVTLGYLRAGLFCNDKALTTQLEECGELSDDKVWNLPVGDEYRSMMDSEIADIANIGTIDRAAGSVTAAVFLKEFVNNTTWAHIDIAGVAWRESKNDLSVVGASGFGVRLLDTLINTYYECK